MKIEQYLKETKIAFPKQFPKDAIFPLEFKYLMEQLDGCQVIANNYAGNIDLMIKYERKNYIVIYEGNEFVSAKVHKSKPPEPAPKKKIKKEVKKNANKKRTYKARQNPIWR